MNILAPIEFLLQFVFKLSYTITKNYGIALIIMSIVITVGTYPLYYIADVWKEKENAIQKLMSDDLNKIKAVYTGQKRFYLVQTTYRIFHYKSWYAFRTSLGILIQIPFFFAAYNVLSTYKGYEGINFLFIKDLSKPDALLGSVNILPFIMTLFNIISSIIYTKSLHLKDNEQQFVLAGVFLLLLYNSPSALLIYWSFNNFLSIFKSLIRLVKNKETICLKINFNFFSKSNLFVLLLLALFISLFILDNTYYIKYIILIQFVIILICFVYNILTNGKKINNEIFAFHIVYLVFLVIYLGRVTIISRYLIQAITIVTGIVCIYYSLRYNKIENTTYKIQYKIILLTSIFFFLLLPLNIYFSNKTEFDFPVKQLIISTILITCILFSLFFLCNRFIFKRTHFISKALLFLFVSYFLYTIFFKLDYGLMSEFAFQKDYSLYDVQVNVYLKDFFILLFIIYIVNYLITTKEKLILPIIYAFIIVYAGLTTIIMVKTRNVVIPYNNVIKNLPKTSYELNTLSKNHKNVIFYMSDMMNGNYFERYLEENPQAVEVLDGFIWYKDTLSIASATINSLPVMFGGLSYTPENLNKTDKKYIEKVEPGITRFWGQLLDRNFKVSYITEWAGLNISNEVLEKYGYNTEDYNIQDCRDYIGYYCKNNNIRAENGYEKIYLLNMLPIFLMLPNSAKKYVYDGGKWNNNQIQINARRKFSLVGIAYLDSFTSIASVKNTDKDVFIYYLGSLTHDPYGINEKGDLINTTAELDTPNLPYYSAKKNIDEFLRIISYLKENKIYDNTMIILCSDHGNAYLDNSLCKEFSVSYEMKNDLSKCNAILLTKNFNTNEKFIIKDSLMQNSDVYDYLQENLFNISNNFSINENNKTRERVYYACNENMADYKNRKINTYNKYNVRGSMFEQESWQVEINQN